MDVASALRSNTAVFYAMREYCPRCQKTQTGIIPCDRHRAIVEHLNVNWPRQDTEQPS